MHNSFGSFLETRVCVCECPPANCTGRHTCVPLPASERGPRELGRADSDPPAVLTWWRKTSLHSSPLGSRVERALPTVNLGSELLTLPFDPHSSLPAFEMAISPKQDGVAGLPWQLWVSEVTVLSVPPISAPRPWSRLACVRTVSTCTRQWAAVPTCSEPAGPRWLSSWLQKADSWVSGYSFWGCFQCDLQVLSSDINNPLDVISLSLSIPHWFPATPQETSGAEVAAPHSVGGILDCRRQGELLKNTRKEAVSQDSNSLKQTARDFLLHLDAFSALRKGAFL